MGKLLPVIIVVVGLVVGGAAGFMLRPAPEPVAEDAAHGEEGDHAAEDGHGDAADEGHDDAADDGHGEEEGLTDFVKLNNQFVVPVIHDARVGALVVMSISVEVTTGGTELVYAREPKLRDQFLQVMFDHANNGGFDGAFTQSGNMTILRRALLEAAQQVVGKKTVRDILIIDIVRQDA